MRRVPREVWWLVGITLVMLVVAFALGQGTGAANRHYNPSRSTYNSGVGGVRALYVTLAKLGYRVHRWRRPFAGEMLPAGTLVMVEPTTPIAPSEWARLHRWVSEGNTLVFCTDGGDLGGEVLSNVVTPYDGEPSVRHAVPSQATYLAQGAERVALRARTRLVLPSATDEPERPRARSHFFGEDEGSPEWRRTLARSVPVFADKEGTAVTYGRLGRGSVIALCSPWTLSNEGLPQADNLPFVLNAVGAPGRAVFFDEYHHGYGENLTWALAPTPAKWAAAQLLLAFCVLVYARSRRFGRIVPLLRESRERSEFLGTMTALLRKGQASRLAVRTAYEAAMHRLRRQLGLPEGAGVEEVGRAASRLEARGGQRLQAALARCRALMIQAAHPAEGAVVAAVRELDEAEQSLQRV